VSVVVNHDVSVLSTVA